MDLKTFYLQNHTHTGLFKGLVHFQMKISPSFTHPQVILGVYGLLINILTHPSFIMAVNDTNEYELKKVHPSIINVLHTAPGG